MDARFAARALASLVLMGAALGCSAKVGSIGAVLARNNDSHALHVLDVPPGLGAAKAGLLPGDEIVMIEGFYVRDLGVKQIKALLRGDVGSTIELTVARGELVLRIRVPRTAFREVPTLKEKEEERQQLREDELQKSDQE